ncbi:MAG: hypothetical protein V4622_11585 [Bacteroidota bacterium]
MKSIILTVCLFAVIQMTNAQEKEKLSPEQKSENFTNHLDSKLFLTDEQEKTVYDIQLRSVLKAEELRKNTRLTKEEKKTAVQSLHKSTSDEIKNVLDSNQKIKFDEIQAKREEKKKEKVK